MNKLVESIIYALPLAALFTLLIQVLLQHRLSNSRARDDRRATKFNEAAEKFRAIVFAQYKGIYPITRISSSDDINSKIWDSITDIESAAIEFSFFLSVRDRRGFIKALKQYQTENHKIDWREQHAYIRFPSMRHMFKQEPKQIFFQHIENLLKYTDEVK